MGRSWRVAALLLACTGLPAAAEEQPDPPVGESRGTGFEIGRSSIDTNRLGYQRGRLGFDLGREMKSHARIPPERRPVEVPPMRPEMPATESQPKVAP